MGDNSKIKKIAENLGIGKIDRHIFLCADPTKAKCASRSDSIEVWDHLKKRLAKEGLTEGEHCVYRTKANCLRVCEDGPIAVVYPEGTWYHSVTKKVIDRIIDEHLKEGKPVEEFVFARNPLPKP